MESDWELYLVLRPLSASQSQRQQKWLRIDLPIIHLSWLPRTRNIVPFKRERIIANLSSLHIQTSPRWNTIPSFGTTLFHFRISVSFISSTEPKGRPTCLMMFACQKWVSDVKNTFLGENSIPLKIIYIPFHSHGRYKCPDNNLSRFIDKSTAKSFSTQIPARLAGFLPTGKTEIPLRLKAWKKKRLP